MWLVLQHHDGICRVRLMTLTSLKKRVGSGTCGRVAVLQTAEGVRSWVR